jgi:hypothetical protein
MQNYEFSKTTNPQNADIQAFCGKEGKCGKVV